MPIVVTELNTFPDECGGQNCFCKNVICDNASTAREVIAANLYGYHLIENLIITPSSGGGSNWIQLLDGASVLFGPIIISDGIPYKHRFLRAIRGTKNTALNVKTQTDIVFHLLLEGKTIT